MEKKRNCTVVFPKARKSFRTNNTFLSRIYPHHKRNKNYQVDSQLKLSVLHGIQGQAAVEQHLGILQWSHLYGPGIIVSFVFIVQSTDQKLRTDK